MAEPAKKSKKLRPLPLAFTRRLFSAHRHASPQIEENHEKNQALEGPDLGYIYGQAVCPPFTIGRSPMKNVGCEIAAAYNALRLLGHDVRFSDVLRDFETSGCVMRGFKQGDMGTDPFSIGDVLAQHGVKAVSYTNYQALASVITEFKGSFQVYILSFWNRNTVFGGLHTVAAYTAPEDQKLHFFNYYINDTRERVFEDLRAAISQNRFVVGYRILPRG